MRASGSTPRLRAVSADMRTSAAAASLMPLALPAVTVPVPSVRNAVRSFASFSRLVSSRMVSSLARRRTPRRLESTTGTISSSNAPESRAAMALRWDAKAKASCSPRVTWKRRATFSAVMPMALWEKASAKPSRCKPSTQGMLPYLWPKRDAGR